MGLKLGKLARRRGGSRSSRNSTSSIFLSDALNNFSSSEEYRYYEYCYSSENAQSENDTDSDDESSSESSLRANTRSLGFLSDAHGSQTGAERLYPVTDLKILGKGAYAMVYLSYSGSSKMYFAIKRAKHMKRGILKSLTREADVLKQLKSPYIIEYLGEHRVPVTLKPSTSATCLKVVPMVSEIYLPYMERGTLAAEIHAYLQKKQLMNESIIQNYARQILSGLSYLHSKKIVHCDIKGSNILLGIPNLKISDFGMCINNRKTPSKKCGPVTRRGTRYYIAPEVQKGIEQGFAADVWSFGCTVVQMITGKPPVTTELKSFLMEETTMLGLAEQMHSDEIPEEFLRLSFECVDFVKKCFIKNTKARWTCKQLLDHPFLKEN